ncbi:MAG TPA: hypothetical protein VGL65_00025 [Gemmatimonadales bacterium]
MDCHIGIFVSLSLAGVASSASAQHDQAAFPGPPPTTATAVGVWDAGIVDRAAQLLGAPTQWNRVDTGTCAAVAQTYSIGCALQKAIEEGAGIHRERGPRVVGNANSPRATCLFRPLAAGWEGGCGSLLDEVPIVTLARASGVASGMWRSDIHPVAVWSGTMADAESVVPNEADQVVGGMTSKQYDVAVIGFNNDSATTFADVQTFFRRLRERVVAQAVADLPGAADAVEIEIYADSTGVIRTYAGWFAISQVASPDSSLRFTVDTVLTIPPSPLDRQILERAATIITSDSVWNRADNRKCPVTAKRWSIYCAVEQAEIEVAGGFHHRRPAMELVREIVDERTAAKTYQHRLMGYNNDPSTTLADVKSLFQAALSRIH